MRIEKMSFYNEAGDEILTFDTIETRGTETRVTVLAALSRAFKGQAAYRITDTGPNHLSVEHEWSSLKTKEEDLMDALYAEGFDLPAMHYGDGEPIPARVHAHLAAQSSPERAPR
jgi:hypothetical protein